MYSLHIALSIGFVVMLLVSGQMTAFASVELNSYVPISGYRITPTFTFSKNVLIDYPDGSKIQNELSGKNFAVEFFGDSDNNTSIKSFMQQLDTQIASDKKNPVSVVYLSVTYQAIIRGDNTRTSIDYTITLKPILTNYVLEQGSADAPTILDMSWMGFDVKEPVVITTPQYGDLEINYPLGLVKNQFPGVYDILKGTPAEDVLNENLMNSIPLVDYSIDKWNTLYDPAFVLTEDAGSEYAGQHTQVTGFAYGQNDLYSNVSKLETQKIDFIADAKYSLTVTEKPSSGTVDVEGHANGNVVQGIPTISTQTLTRLPSAVASSPWWSGTQGVILWLAIAGAGMVIFWALYFARNRE
jgi:hypothetical protein